MHELELLFQDIRMIRHDLARLVGPRDAVVRMADELLIGLEMELNVREEAGYERRSERQN